ncbi:MAG: hypothetical protein ACOC9D_07150 [Thermodesulfobacteriota bacterium]
MGLIQRVVESAGIPTLSMGNSPDRMQYSRPTRALVVKFPRGCMFGEPKNRLRQRRIIMDGLQAFQTMTEPGAIIELPYRWKRPDPE